MHTSGKPRTQRLSGTMSWVELVSNHGFLNRNGSNITIPAVLGAIAEAFNFQPINILRQVSKMVLLSNDDPDFVALEEIALHGVLEHDVSLSRQDIALGNNIVFDSSIFETLKNSNPGVDYYNITSAAKVMDQRLIEATAVNPNLTNTQKEFIIRSNESGFYIGLIGNITTGVAPKQYVQILFEEERLPIAEGWRPSSVPITDQNFPALVNAIAAATTWAPSGPIVCPWTRLQPEGPISYVPFVSGADVPL
ncbi:Peroxidase, family 2-domain-containing protein [Rhodocollybia butyracea]|uniref:Peroxidase, family 2-domain-containing protein n=1 Tax=Rhodocollybia butyracea TaxID=206335 RepID=A0A9P5PK50_9AGAR|nr:Peroxidase, family 2-domain-containing protein [Rhodocollybia butyracea]